MSTVSVIDLQDRPVYGFAQVDRVLGLKPSTSARWIDGYRRSGKDYPPVIRVERTGDEVVTWGEFIEARLLADYRDAGVPLVKMRPAVEKLREELNTPYPLASAKTLLAAEGRELVRRVQEKVGLDHRLRLVVVRNDQEMIDLSHQAQEFRRSLQWDHAHAGREKQVVASLQPDPEVPDVVVNPLQRFGEPCHATAPHPSTQPRPRSYRSRSSSPPVGAGDSDVRGTSRRRVAGAFDVGIGSNVSGVH